MPKGKKTDPFRTDPKSRRSEPYYPDYPAFGYGGFGVGRGGFPRGGGRGRTFGGGRGWLWRTRVFGYPPYAPPYPPSPYGYPPDPYGYPPAYPQPTAEEEKEILGDELSALEEEMEGIRARIKELEKEGKKEKK